MPLLWESSYPRIYPTVYPAHRRFGRQLRKGTPLRSASSLCNCHIDSAGKGPSPELRTIWRQANR